MSKRNYFTETMEMIWFGIIFFSFLVLSRNYDPEYKVNLHRWKYELSQSLKANIHSCPWNYGKVFSMVNDSILNPFSHSKKKKKDAKRKISIERGLEKSSEIKVEYLFPSLKEFKQMKQLPLTLTKAHRDVPVTAAMRRYNDQEWGSENILRWEVPRYHPGQNRKNCIKMTKISASGGKIYSFYENFRQIDRSFYLMQVFNGFVHPSGSVMTQCGYYQGEESCENRWNQAKDWTKICHQWLHSSKIPWGGLFNKSDMQGSHLQSFQETCLDHSESGTPFKNSPQLRKIEKVFVISALWDYNYHHFVADSLARLAPVYRLLLEQEDIFIHIRSFEDYDRLYEKSIEFQYNAKKMRSHFFDLLGINESRVVSGHVLAQEIFIPRSLRCSYALSNPIELRRLKDILWQRALHHIQINYPGAFNIISDYHLFKTQEEYSSSVSILTLLPKKFLESTSLYWPKLIPKTFIENQLSKSFDKYLLIYQRYSPSSSDRYWNDELFASIILSFGQSFPQHIILPLSSKQLFKSNYCMACDFLMYSLADVFVAAHGAGLTNILFSPLNTLVVEIAGEFKDVNMPVCGYYGPFAAIFGHHHYLYSYSHEENWELQSQSAGDEAAAFYSFISQPVHSEGFNSFVVHVRNSTGGFPYRP